MKRVRRNKSNLVIREHNPWKVFLWLVVAMILVSLGIALAFEFGTEEGGYKSVQVGKDSKDSQTKLAALEKMKRELTQENKSLHTQVARLQSQNRIDAHAHERVKLSYLTQRKDNLELREEIQFYKDIVAPNKDIAGLQIQNFKIDEGGEKGLYFFRLTLIQSHGSSDRVRVSQGTINLQIIGKSPEGSDKTLNIKDFAPASEEAMKFNLKYLQRIEGKIALPAGFRPASVRIQVIPNRGRGQQMTSIEKRIEWPFKSG